jgi:exonuclease III
MKIATININNVNRRLPNLLQWLSAAKPDVNEIRVRLDTPSSDDRELRFALNRKIYKELSYDERSSKPVARRKLKAAKFKEQNGLCAE